jgi:hypothetical protein
MFIRVGIFRVVMCEHGPSKGPDDIDEAACAYYENPENLVPTGPGRKRRPAARVSVAAMWGVFRRFFWRPRAGAGFRRVAEAPMALSSVVVVLPVC